MRILGKSEKWEMFNLELSVDGKVGLAIKISDRSSREALSLGYSRNVCMTSAKCLCCMTQFPESEAELITAKYFISPGHVCLGV